MASYFVYILESLKDKSYYIGVTCSLERRIKEHNEGKSRFTKSRRPFRLIYQERHDNIKDAYKREKYLKSLKKRAYIEKLINFNLPR